MDTLRVSYSSLGTFSSCPRKFEFDKFYPKRDREWGDNYAADVGKALHSAYQDYLIHGDQDRAIFELMRTFPFELEYQQDNDYRSFDAALSTLEEMFAEIRMDEYELAQIKRPWSPKEIADFGLRALHGEDLSHIDATGLVVPAIEVPFEIRFKGLMIPPCAMFPEGAGISIIGYIDAIMRHHMTSMFRTLDIKTTRDRLIDATPKFKFDTQQVPYGVVVEHVAQGAVDSFEVLYLSCFVDLTEPRVSLYPFMKDKQDLQDWASNKILQFQNIAKMAAMDFFPRTDNGCLFYNKPCRYLEPCGSRDREELEAWFLLGEEPAKNREEFHPWIVADVDVGV
jgi:hypothetical protein